MGFIGGCITGIVLTLMVFFILLFVAKALGFSLFIKNEYRRVTPNYNDYALCKDCFYKESYYKESYYKKYEDDEMEEKDND